MRIPSVEETIASVGEAEETVNGQGTRERSQVNKTPQAVRLRVPEFAKRRCDDRRVRRTQQALVQALVELVLERRYDSITIQNLLDRADVGRTTFYSHYRGKDDLLLRSFERMLEGLDQTMGQDEEAAARLAPVRELFQHVGEFRSFHQALVRARLVDRLYQAGTSRLSRTIEHRLARMTPPTHRLPVPLAVQAQALAGALFALLRWWLDHGQAYSPAQMDEMLHALRPQS